jgi:hypothetical protein
MMDSRMTSREKLKPLEGQRITVTALIERHAHTTPDAYLLCDVRDAASGSLLTDHLWIGIGKWADGFRPQDQIEFSARVIPYRKGWRGDPFRAPEDAPLPSIDWALAEVSEARIIVFGPQVRMMPDGSVRPGPTDKIRDAKEQTMMGDSAQ